MLHRELRQTKALADLREFRGIHRARDVYDSELARATRDDGESVDGVLTRRDVDVDIVRLVTVLTNLYQAIPSRRGQLASHRLDDRPIVVSLELEAADVDRLQSLQYLPQVTILGVVGAVQYPR